MRWFFSLILFIIAVFINSCSKGTDKGPDNSADTSLKVKRVTRDFLDLYDPSYNTHSVYTLYYDDQDRLIRMESDSTNINFEYNNNVIQKDIYPNSNSAQHIYYYFNSASLLDSSVSITESSPDTIHNVYTYNSKNQIIQETETTISSFGNIKEKFLDKYEYDSKGNLITLTTYLDSNFFYSRNSFTYSDSANFSNTADMIYPDDVHSPNLLKTSFFEFWIVQSSSQTTYNYKFDNYNRIDSVISQNDNTASNFSYKDIVSYTYY